MSKRLDIDTLLEGLFILPLNTEIAKLAGFIYQDLRRKGKMIEITDILIAATVLNHSLSIKTLNIDHVQRIASLVVI